MEEVVLYSTGCPKCEILKKKLEEKGIEYSINSSVEEMLALGMTMAPGLMVDGRLMNFAEAVRWANEQ